MIQAAAGHQHAPPVALALHEREQASHQGPEAILSCVGPAQPVAHPGVHAAHDPHLHGVDQAPSVAQVGVDQGAGDPRCRCHLVERDQERVVLGEELLGGVDDQAAPSVGVQACGAGPAGWTGTGIGQADAPTTSTEVIDSSGASGWWQATNWWSATLRISGTSSRH